MAEGLEKVAVAVTTLLCVKRRAYGVMSQEYGRYAQYCVRRGAKLRARIRKLSTAVGMKGPKPNYSPEFNQNEWHIQVLFYKAEGCWARFRMLKTEGKRSIGHQHARSRLRKCQYWWDLALACAKAFCDEAAIAEVGAWRDYMRAGLAIELERWQEALTLYGSVRSQFAKFTDSGDALLAQSAQSIIEDVAPLIALCNFNIGGSDAETEVGVSGRGAGQIVWRERVISLTHDGLIRRVAQLNALAADRQVAEAHAAREILKKLRASRDGDDLRALDEFLSWRTFVATLEMSQEKFASQHGVARAETAAQAHARVVAEQARFGDVADFATLALIWHAQKIFALAEIGDEPVHVAALSNVVEEAREAAEHAVDEGLRKRAEELCAAARRLRIVKVAALNGVAGSVAPVSDESFLRNQDVFLACRRLVDVPPEPRVVYPKPAIFNRAEDFLEYPDLARRKKGWRKFWG